MTRIRNVLAASAVAGVVGLFVAVGASAGADVGRSQPPPPVFEVSPAAFSDALEGAAPAVSDLAESGQPVRPIEFNVESLRASLAAGTFALPLPDGGQSIVTGGAFGPSAAVDTEHWSAVTSTGVTSVTLTEHGVYATANVDGVSVTIVPVSGVGQTTGMHVVYSATDGPTPAAVLPLDRVAAELALPPVPDGMVRVMPHTALDAGGVRAVSVNQLLRADSVRAFQSGPETLRLLVLLDSVTVGLWGGNGPAVAQATAAINSTNTTLAASGIDAQVDPVFEIVNYTSATAVFTAQARLRARHDGYVDEAHTLRETHDADLVMLLTTVLGGCGIAELPAEAPSAETEHAVFSVVDVGNPACIESRYSIAHEIGHGLGARHDDANAEDDPPPFRPYSFGWVDPINDFVTIMAYTDPNNGCQGCLRIPQFSSDSDTWMGHPTGDANHNNAVVVNASAPAVAAYRPDPCVNPNNDFFGARQPFGSTSSAAIVDSNECASAENFELGESYQMPLHSVWYEWAAPSTDLTRVTTCQPDTAIDTVVTVWEGSPTSGDPSQLTKVGVDDDDFACPHGFMQSTVDFTPASTGSVYYIQVDGRDSERGDIGLLITQQVCDGELSYVDGPCSAGCVIDGASAPTVMSQAECNALVDLFNATDGPNWGDNSSWLVTVSVSTCPFGTTPQSTPSGVKCKDANGVLHPPDVLRTASDPCTWVGVVCDASGLVGLNLASNGLAGELPTSMGLMVTLASLDLSGNQLFGEVPQGLSTIGPLTNISLEDNRCLSANAFTTVWLTIVGQANSIGQGCGVCGGQTVTITIALGQNGTPGNDVILGTAGPDVVNGRGGNDIICGEGGSDRIVGGAGDDVIYGGDGIDRLDGGADDDTIHGDGGSDRINAGPGNDMVFGGPGADRISGGAGDDRIFGMGGQDRLRGDGGNDVVQGNSQSDLITGGPGDDILRGSKGKDVLWGGAGDDELYGGDNTDFLGGGSGMDLAHGQRGNDGPYFRGISGCDEAEQVISCRAPAPTD